jgi:hypothetical protein
VSRFSWETGLPQDTPDPAQAAKPADPAQSEESAPFYLEIWWEKTGGWSLAENSRRLSVVGKGTRVDDSFLVVSKQSLIFGKTCR